MLRIKFTLASIISLVAISIEAYSDPYHENNHPILARILKENGEVCTGAYYKSGFIITSGACAEGVNRNDTVILKNESLNQDPLSTFNVIRSFTHPKYSSEIIEVESNYDGHLIKVVAGESYDLGLVQIDISQNKPDASKLTIAGRNKLDKVNTPLEGIIWDIEDVLAEIPKLDNYTDYVDLDIMSNDQCGKSGETMNPHLTFCAGQPRFGGLSYYDYGAPLVHHDGNNSTLVGVFSKSQPGKGVADPFIVTKVAPFTYWILETIKFNSVTQPRPLKKSRHVYGTGESNQHFQGINDNRTNPDEEDLGSRPELINNRV